jgi:hypothetical protein
VDGGGLRRRLPGSRVAAQDDEEGGHADRPDDAFEDDRSDGLDRMTGTEKSHFAGRLPGAQSKERAFRQSRIPTPRPSASARRFTEQEHQRHAAGEPVRDSHDRSMDLESLGKAPTGWLALASLKCRLLD